MADPRKTPVRNYLQRREQWRLLTLILALGLVAILINEVRKPGNWRWFAALSDEENDSSVKPTADPASPVDPQRSPQRAPGESENLTDVSGTDPSREVPKDPALEGVFGLTPEQLQTIQDDSMSSFLPEEAETEAWLRLLKILRQNDQSSIESESEGLVTYTQLFAQPNEYRGKLVTLKGIVHRVNRVSTPRNDDGFEKYWKFWLFPTDDADSPIVVYCLDLPEEFPTGMDVEAKVEMTGFFFKRWAYNAWNPYSEETVLAMAPIVLTKTVRWHPPLLATEEESVTIDGRFFATIIGVAIIVSFLIAMYIYSKTRRGRSEQPELAVNLDVLLGSGISPKNGTAPKSQTSED